MFSNLSKVGKFLKIAGRKKEPCNGNVNLEMKACLQPFTKGAFTHAVSTF